ncbi:hypothetical protein Bca52824_088695 [Brassica carinata]|uniref:Pentatricopeptide repeat-containing protein n=1 Tax=Brassica carinata TaxID=52824 RepID=A0A8X7PDT4_BRACI|nr:hypothetical protein Bca52824_088695 [Brassica carinata]
MYRAIWRYPLRFMVGSSSLRRPTVSLGQGRSGIDNGDGGCSCSRSVTTLIGNEFIPCQDESTRKILQEQILIHGNNPLSAHDFHGILKYCARSPDPVFVMETYSVMCKREISLDSRSLLFIVQALCNGGHLDKYLLFACVQLFSWSLCKTRKGNYASRCLELMDQRRVGKNEITYAAHLKLAVLQRNLPSVNEILKHYVDHYSLSILSLRKGELFVKFKSGKLHSTRLDIPIPSSGQTQIGPEKVAFGGVNDHTVSLMVDAVECKSSDQESNGIESFKVALPKGQSNIPANRILRWSFSDLAEQLMLQMQNLGLPPSSHTYDGFIRAVAFPGAYEYGMILANQVDLAEHLLDQVSECSDAYPFNNLLAACDSLDQPERAVRVLARMKQLNRRPDMRTYELLFSLFGNWTVKRINAIEKDMLRNGFQHSPVSTLNVLRALGSEGMVNEMIRHLQRAENMYLETPTYNIVLQSLLEANETNMVIKIFKRMKACGYPADAATYNIMIDCCSIIHSYKSASVTFTALMKILLYDENFEEALKLMDQAASEGIHLDVLSYNTILRKAFEKGMIDVIEYIVEQMHREKVNPDPSTCHFVFNCYVRKGITQQR